MFTHCSFDKTKNKLDYYRGEDCIKKFCKDLREHATKIINYEKKDMTPLTKKEEKHYNKQKVSYVCKKEFNTDDSDKKHHKVKDHCHYTGKYRGAAHNICNLRYRIPKEIPVVFRNGSTYDYHFIIKELVKEFDGNFECLGENTEKYITFSVPLKKEIKNKNKIIEITYKIKFIDSFRFMSTLLSKLVDNLSEGLHNNRCVDCKSCLDYMKNKDEKLIFRCFSYKKNYEKDLMKHHYPIKSIFIVAYDIDQRHGNVFQKFKLKNLGEYHDLYVQSDTLLLADIFENFRNMCIKVYELDPAHFLSLPGLAWKAYLKKTNVKLELLTDYDMLLMVEEGIRGGICHLIHRYAKANNKYMKYYNKNKESLYIQYLDANNLYGLAMFQKLPVNGFKWIKDVTEIDEKFIKNYNEDNEKGYILEVDVKYPRKLHDLHSDLPFLPKRMKIDKCKKLVCNLRNKKKYVVHIRSLKQALNHGLKLKKVHRIIEFNQETWLKTYIDMNTKLRKIAENDFEKDFLKLMNNAVYGKTMENVRKHRDIKLVTTHKKRSKLVSEPNYHTINSFSENLSIIEMRRTKVTMNKPIYLGLSILEISKILMYEFWYDYMKLKYGDNVKLCYMDNDSFIMNIKTEDFYKDIGNDVEKRFDTSNYEVAIP